MIRRSYLSCLALLFAAAANITSADASLLQVGDIITFNNGPGSYAGEFGLAFASDPGANLFRTFCTEKDEYINFNDDYVVDSIQDVILGGGQNTDSGDPLDGKTKWLYWNFHNGSLAGYDGTGTSADRLQNTVWRIEEESYDLAQSTFYYDLALAAESAGGLNGTLLKCELTGLNISHSVSGNEAQSMLYVLDPLDSPTVPEPGSIAIWSILGLCAARRAELAKV